MQAIIDIHGLDVNEVSDLLFPGISHPRLAFNRILSKETTLKSDQIIRLASYLDIKVDDLYNNSWKSYLSKKVHTFTNKDYVAKIYQDTWTVKIFFKNDLFHEHVLLNKNITMSEFLKMIETIILKHKKHGTKN